ncbi:hypothetical protein [Heyndrickxia acidiproducens]|uniref:hypothetical protein n=1 Tax=Heyndrickxia acidiproducens TaxID=1121084 RepID=UPI0003706F60|nr:hypothetical protein [Heyndrickxia acidiproducens]
MRATDKNETVNKGIHQIYGVNFRDYSSSESNAVSAELATEFGLSSGEAKLLKKKLGRN